MDKNTRVERHRRAKRVLEILKQLVELDVPNEITCQLVAWVQTELCPHTEAKRERGCLRKCYLCGAVYQPTWVRVA